MNKTLISQVITILTPVVVPMVVLFVKTTVLPFLQESHKWAIPILAVLIGAGFDYVNGLLTGTSLGVFGGAALGALGVVLREVKDQIQRNP